MHTHMHTSTQLPPSYSCITYHISYPAKSMASPRPDHKHKTIPVSEFGTHVTMLHENNNQGFKAEYDVSWINVVLLM